MNMSHVRGQGYDGCSTMSGCYTGAQSRVRAISKCAYFVHCFAQRLNLVFVDTCCKNAKVRNFFGVVASLYDFIEGSTKRGMPCSGLFVIRLSLRWKMMILWSMAAVPQRYILCRQHVGPSELTTVTYWQ